MLKCTYFWKGAASIFTGILLVLFIAPSLLGVISFKNDPIIVRILFVVIPILLFILSVNYFPDIIISEKHLILKARLLKNKYEFQLDEMHPIVGFSSVGTPIKIVKISNCNKLSLFPLIVFGFFFIHSSIDNYAEIISLIEKNN